MQFVIDEANGLFINFWYPAAQSAQVTGTPLLLRMLGQDFVVWRDDNGTVNCLSNTCSHRGGSLGRGKVVNGHIQCPYHGWRFDGAGNCKAIPSLGPNASVPARTRVDAYPVVERYGLVFCFLGDLPEAERPPIMHIKEWGLDGWTHTTQEFEFPVNFERSIENGLDPAHNEFVHDTHGFKGEWKEYRTPKVELEETEWGTGFSEMIKAPPLPEKEMAKASGRTGDAMIWVATGHEGVASLWTFIHPSEQMHIQQYAFETPVDEHSIKVWLINMRNFLLDPAHDRRIMERNQYVAFQDRDVLQDLHPRRTPQTNNNEYFLPADLCIGRYRERLADWQARGWRIDIEAVRKTERRVAYAIPSPARRLHKGWVLDPIPLVAASSS